MSEDKGPHKFWEGTLLHKIPGRKEWRPLWVVLKGRTMMFFKDRENYINSLVGEIQLDLTIQVKLSKKEHTVFELHQKISKKEKKDQKFKCQSKADREIWRAFIVGVAKGEAPSDLDWSTMLPGQRDDLLRFVRFLESGGLQSMGLSFDRMSNGSSGSGGSSSFDTNDSTGGTTVQKHLKPVLQLSQQSWYFDHIDRDKGEQILNLGQAYGNLLVRPSVTRKGNFVIQYRAPNRWGEPAFYNFLVEKTGHGYSLVINDPEIPVPVCEAAMNPKPTVFEILNFFELNVARFLSTVEPQPMITNDLNELGLWGEYGACPNTLQRPDPASRQRRVRFGHSRTSGIIEEEEDDFALPSELPTSPTSSPPPLPPANNTLQSASSRQQHRLQRTHYPESEDSGGSGIPPPPQAPAPPPPPGLSPQPGPEHAKVFVPPPSVVPAVTTNTHLASHPIPTYSEVGAHQPVHKNIQSAPLPPVPQPVGPAGGGPPPPPPPPPPPIPSGGIPKPPPPKEQNSTDLGSALRGVTLKKAASADSNGNIDEEDEIYVSTFSQLDLAIKSVGRTNRPSRGGPPVMDFQDELRKKLNKRFIYDTPEALRAGKTEM